MFYNGFTTAEMYAGTGLRQLGIEHVKPILTRGCSIDLPAYKNVASPRRRLRGDARRRARRAGAPGIAESSIAPGDAVCSVTAGPVLEQPAEYSARIYRGSAWKSRAGSSNARSRDGQRHVENEVSPNRVRAWLFPCIRSSS